MLLAPGQSRGELQTISRSQFVSVQETPGQIAHMIPRKDLSPSATQQIETRQSSLFLSILQFAQAMQACDGALNFNPAPPPHYLRESPQLRLRLSTGSVINTV